MTHEFEDSTRQSKARRWLTLGAFGLLVGIALSALGQGPVGGWICVAAAIAMIIGLHTFGRLGPDAPCIPPDAEAKPKTKAQKPRKKKKSLP